MSVKNSGDEDNRSNKTGANMKMNKVVKYFRKATKESTRCVLYRAPIFIKTQICTMTVEKEHISLSSTAITVYLYNAKYFGYRNACRY